MAEELSFTLKYQELSPETLSRPFPSFPELETLVWFRKNIAMNSPLLLSHFAVWFLIIPYVGYRLGKSMQRPILGAALALLLAWIFSKITRTVITQIGLSSLTSYLFVDLVLGPSAVLGLMFAMRGILKAQGSSAQRSLGSGLAKGHNPEADYEYKGLRGMYLALNLKARTLLVKGASRKRGKADFERLFDLGDIRSVRSFSDVEVWGLCYAGMELEVNSLDTPVVRVVMSPRDTDVWISRIIQVCGMSRN